MRLPVGEKLFDEAKSASGRASAELALTTGAEGKKQCFVSKISKLCGLLVRRAAAAASAVVTNIDVLPEEDVAAVVSVCCCCAATASSDGKDSLEVSVSRRGGN